MRKSLAVTIIGPNRPGIISQVADAAAKLDANWQESHLANLAGQFAGIVQLEVDAGKSDELKQTLEALSSDQLAITVAESGDSPASAAGERLALEITGQDRPGIVRDISRAIADIDVSIESLETDSFSGSMSGEDMFTANAVLLFPDTQSIRAVKQSLHALSESLLIDIELVHDSE